MKIEKTLLLALSWVATGVDGTNPDGWETCGGLAPALNRTACPTATATCCTQKWAPGDGNWGCVDWVNATCCGSGYTACPPGTTCQNTGEGWRTVSKCIPNANTDNVRTETGQPLMHESTGMKVPTPTTGVQVCKQGAPMPFSPIQPNVLILGDSVSIGYTPYVATLLQDVALVQHTPWYVRKNERTALEECSWQLVYKSIRGS